MQQVTITERTVIAGQSQDVVTTTSGPLSLDTVERALAAGPLVYVIDAARILDRLTTTGNASHAWSRYTMVVDLDA